MNRHSICFNGVGIDIVNVVHEFIKECLFPVNNAITEQQQKKKKPTTEDNVDIQSKCKYLEIHTKYV